MATLRHIHQLMNERRLVLLNDGRVGKVVRVDTTFPGNDTTVTIWTQQQAPSMAKVPLNEILGGVDSAQSA